MNGHLSIMSLLVTLCPVGVAPAFWPMLDRGPAQYRQRLNRAVYSCRGRVTFLAPELAERVALEARAVRCSVFESRAGITGRSVF